MDVKHDIRSKMKKQLKEQREEKIKEHLIEVYNLMADGNGYESYRTINLLIGNGYKVVCTILEDKDNES